jgi:hypothetical protein
MRTIGAALFMNRHWKSEIQIAARFMVPMRDLQRMELSMNYPKIWKGQRWERIQKQSLSFPNLWVCFLAYVRHHVYELALV